MTLEHGPLDRLLLDLANVTLNIREDQRFEAEAVDAYGNAIVDAAITWNTDAGTSTIDGEGLLTAGVRAGTFPQGVTVTAELDGFAAEATASVTVNPDLLDIITLTPPSVRIAAGESSQLEAVAKDKFGNVVQPTGMSWTVADGNAGSISEAGLLTAAEIAGSFGRIIGLKASEGPKTRSAQAFMTITPHLLDRVVPAPVSASLGIGMTQQFVAVGVDRFGNRIPGLDFAWSIENGGGTIGADGLFTAGNEPGTYEDTVRVAITQGDTEYHAEISVVVEADRIAFVSRTDDQWDLYLMDADGSDVQRLTEVGASFLPNPSWSPDGRRIVYDRCFSLGTCTVVAMNDDGSWATTLFEHGAEPSWSPDGRQIAFASFNGGEDLNVYLRDVAGGLLRSLTASSAVDTLRSWSPDGLSIAFVSERDGNREIYVMDADGSAQKRLTNDPDRDTFPVWSPDGSEILFQSARDGDFELYVMSADASNVTKLTSNNDFDGNARWSPDGTQIVFNGTRDSEADEIYVMDANGTNVRRLTNNSSTDASARWAPRKSGVDVTEVSVIVGDASVLEPSTVADVTANARAAIVRIVTDLASGSGFIIDRDDFLLTSRRLVLTNHHVIRDAKEITVFTEDGTSYAGTVLGRDLVRDLALIEVGANGLPTLEFGDLSRLPLGSEALVLGFPLGETELTVTRGVVSAIKFDSGRNVSWVQTDAAINPGNSGGPLLNLQGEVVGVVTSKNFSAEVEGVGFAISTNTLRLYLERLKAGEVITSVLASPTQTFYEIPSLTARVTGLRFFESPFDVVPKGERVYSISFDGSKTQFINWELNLAHPAPGRGIDLVIGAVYRRGDRGSIYAEQAFDGHLESHWTSSEHSWGWGSQDPDWPVGSYRVEVSIDGLRVASGEFEVF